MAMLGNGHYEPERQYCRSCPRGRDAAGAADVNAPARLKRRMESHSKLMKTGDTSLSQLDRSDFLKSAPGLENDGDRTRSGRFVTLYRIPVAKSLATSTSRLLSIVIT